MIQITINNEEFRGLVCEFDEEPLLRDLFAAAALCGLNILETPKHDIEKAAYNMADRMLARRKERQP